ncbi:hypothetical protein [Paenibacillus sp. S150]|uniref:hypothetical protein n=1 Tax=Paenibacillus sp. S150 TaxID=2749826 RepID=UPI001C59B5D3|nr:hypothetical protein [Paenibacillus sp. S150]MBW4083503.1 hypothetical protein [Paenibacillus sp. S150]
MLELLPGWMQKMNPWLPMTHSTVGCKAIIASCGYILLREQTVYLFTYAVIFLALTLLYFARQTKRTPAALKELTA